MSSDDDDDPAENPEEDLRRERKAYTDKILGVLSTFELINDDKRMKDALRLVRVAVKSAPELIDFKRLAPRLATIYTQTQDVYYYRQSEVCMGDWAIDVFEVAARLAPRDHDWRPLVRKLFSELKTEDNPQAREKTFVLLDLLYDERITFHIPERKSRSSKQDPKKGKAEAKDARIDEIAELEEWLANEKDAYALGACKIALASAKKKAALDKPTIDLAKHMRALREEIPKQRQRQ